MSRSDTTGEKVNIPDDLAIVLLDETPDDDGGPLSKFSAIEVHEATAEALGRFMTELGLPRGWTPELEPMVRASAGRLMRELLLFLDGLNQKGGDDDAVR